MITRILSIFVLTVSLWGGAVGIASAAEGLPSSQDEALLKLINEARRSPLTVAASMGMDPEKILRDLPELKQILKDGLLPLTFNAKLAEAARAHTNDMFARGYYSHISPDGRNYDERIRESGYPAVASGESLGMILFANFIKPEEAVRLIFQYMFQDELDPSRTEKRNILDPAMREAGIAVRTGAFDVGGSFGNVYLMSADFGRIRAEALSSLKDGELTLLHLINQARAKPLQVAASLGMDPGRLLADLPELYDTLTRGLPPLGFNEKLHATARGHNMDMLENGYFSHNSPDGRSYQERIIEGGYDATAAEESLGMLTFTDCSVPEKAISLIFEGMFRDELNPLRTEKRNILDPKLREVGIGFGFSGNACVATCDFGARAGQEGPYLVGLVYRDLNVDMAYNPGEGLPGIPISIDVPGRMIELVTDAAGGFSLMLGPGATRVIATLPKEEVAAWFYLEEENQILEFKIAPGT